MSWRKPKKIPLTEEQQEKKKQIMAQFQPKKEILDIKAKRLADKIDNVEKQLDEAHKMRHRAGKEVESIEAEYDKIKAQSQAQLNKITKKLIESKSFYNKYSKKTVKLADRLIKLNQDWAGHYFV